LLRLSCEVTRLARRTFGGNGQPVFDLPPGSTASSLALGLVDNVVPGPENPSSGVPAPASLVLVALGCVAAMGVRARRTPIVR
jgi:hypothetical protein